MTTRLSFAVVAAGLLAACGGDEQTVRAPIPRETPATEILRIGKVWSSTATQKKLLTPPSAINFFEATVESRVTLSPDKATEELVIDETVKLRSGGQLRCQTSLKYDLGIRWGRREGESAVELTRPPISTPRICDQPGHPEPTIERAGGSTRFVLRSDNLVAVDPATDGRTYLPTD